MTSTTLQPKELGTSAILMMANGSLADFAAVIHPEATNREASAEPPASRGRGPAAFYATACWLREAFADVCWEIEHIVADRDLVVLHTTMCGRHVNTFVSYDETGRPAQAFPATGRAVSTGKIGNTDRIRR